MEPEVHSQVGKEDEREVGCHWQGPPGDLKPDNQPRPVSMSCLQFPPIFAVSELAPFLLPICDVLLLLHPVEAAVEPAAHSSIYSFVASTFHQAVDVLKAVVAVLVVVDEVGDREVVQVEPEEEEDEQAMEVQAEHIEWDVVGGE